MNHEHGWRRLWLGVALVLVLALLGANLILTLKLSERLDATLTRLESKRSLACAAVPIRFVVDSPECANLLLQAMNVTNVRIVPREAWPLAHEREAMDWVRSGAVQTDTLG